MKKQICSIYSYLLIIGLSIAFFACENEEDNQVSNLGIKQSIDANTVLFTATADNAISYDWNFGDGDTGTGAIVEKSYAAKGIYTVVCNAIGSENSMKDSITVDLSSDNVFVSNLKISIKLADERVILSASADNAFEYIWNFSDGKSGKGASVEHTYSAAGEYWIKCEAKNSINSVYDSVKVNILEPIVIPNRPFGAGYRYSHYGPSYNPGNEYWWKVGDKIANDFGDNATPECIWILGTLQGQGVYLNFPVETSAENITWSSTDKNEEIFCHFDTIGYKVWLQIEPGMADVDTLINLILDKYAHHKCITGFGVDVEWYKSTDEAMGVKVNDALAKQWVKAVRKYNPEYRIFLKHWLTEMMPDNERDGIVFVDDSQMFNSMSDMVNEFEYWGKYFAPAKVGFQYGYSPDEKWFKHFSDPNLRIGSELLNRIPNTASLFWVDFTLLETYPPSTLD